MPLLRPLVVILVLMLANHARAGGSDRFDSATVLAGLTSDTGNNLSATAEAGEPAHGNGGPAASVWWRWSAVSNGLYSITTLGSSFDTVLGVYTGITVDSLTRIAGNDDSPGEDATSRVMLHAMPGVSYAIAVDGYGGETGDISLRVEAAPDTRMEGTVRNGSGDPLADIEVVAWKRVLLPDGERWDRTASLSTGPDGTYALLGLPAGAYALYFFDSARNHAGQFLGGVQETDEAGLRLVQLAPGIPETGLDTALALGAHISGRVTLATDGSPLSGVAVDVATPTGVARGELRVFTGGDGRYSVRGLPIGAHYLAFSRGVDFLEHWHAAAASFEQAVPVTLAFPGDSVSDIDEALTPGGILSGRVAAHSGNTGIEGIHVQVMFGTGGLAGVFYTDADGLYRTSPLAAGSYRLRFFDAANQRYLDQWYANESSFEEAMPVDITSGSETPGLDVFLIEASSLAGRVTAANGLTGVSNVVVEATFGASGFPAGTVQTSSDGSYLIPNLAAGAYFLRFSDPQNRYLPEWHLNASQVEQALEIVVGEGAHLTGLDASLALVPTVTPPRILSHRVIGNGLFAFTWVAQADFSYHVLRAASAAHAYQLAPTGSEANQQALIPAGAQRFIEYADPAPAGAPGHTYKVEWVPSPASSPVP